MDVLIEGYKSFYRRSAVIHGKISANPLVIIGDLYTFLPKELMRAFFILRPLGGVFAEIYGLEWKRFFYAFVVIISSYKYASPSPDLHNIFSGSQTLVSGRESWLYDVRAKSTQMTYHLRKFNNISI